MTVEHQNFKFFGICPFVSSENILARLQLGLSKQELEPQQIENEIADKIERNSFILIPSHFWWREDSESLLELLTPYAPKIVLQCGPGFELSEKLELIEHALNKGFRLQIVCQKKLSYAQENRLQSILQHREQIEISLFVEEAEEAFGDLKYFCENFLDLLNISLTKYSFGLLAELAEVQTEFSQLKFLDLSREKAITYSQAIEGTQYAKSTALLRSSRPRTSVVFALNILSSFISLIFLPSFEKIKRFRTKVKGDLQILWGFLVTIWSKSYWPSRSVCIELYWQFIRSFTKTYWVNRSVFSNLIWFSKRFILSIWWHSQAIGTKSYWLTRQMTSRSYWTLWSLNSDSKAFMKVWASRSYWTLNRLGSISYWKMRELISNFMGLLKYLATKLFWIFAKPFIMAYWAIRRGYYNLLVALECMVTKSYWHLRSFISNAQGMTNYIGTILYWTVIRTSTQAYWPLRAFFLNSYGQSKKCLIVSFWRLANLSSKTFWMFFSKIENLNYFLRGGRGASEKLAVLTFWSIRRNITNYYWPVYNKFTKFGGFLRNLRGIVTKFLVFSFWCIVRFANKTYWLFRETFSNFTGSLKRLQGLTVKFAVFTFWFSMRFASKIYWIFRSSLSNFAGALKRIQGLIAKFAIFSFWSGVRLSNRVYWELRSHFLLMVGIAKKFLIVGFYWIWKCPFWPLRKLSWILSSELQRRMPKIFGLELGRRSTRKNI